MKVSRRKKANRNPRITCTFAVRQGIGGDSPCLEGTILRNGETWHEKVRGNGGSYSRSLTDKEIPDDIVKGEGETIKEFERRIREIERNW